jgi:hypothetical protein
MSVFVCKAPDDMTSVDSSSTAFCILFSTKLRGFRLEYLQVVDAGGPGLPTVMRDPAVISQGTQSLRSRVQQSQIPWRRFRYRFIYHLPFFGLNPRRVLFCPDSWDFSACHSFFLIYRIDCQEKIETGSEPNHCK